MWWLILGVIVAALAVLLYFEDKKSKNYWSSKGFATIDGGNSIVDMLRKVHIKDFDLKLYKALKEINQPYAGSYELSKPLILIKDLELMRQIFVKDFDHFVDHQEFHADELTEKMLFFMTGEPWKELRSKMSPTFTTGKIRRMFGIYENSSERFLAYLKEELKTTPTINLAEGYGKFTLDVISSAAFGLESQAFLEKKSMFETMAQKLPPGMSIRTIIKFIIIFVIPKLSQLLKMVIFDAEATSFFRSAIMSTIKHREATGEKREDFLQLMLDASAGQLKTDESELSTFEKEAAVTVGTGRPKISLTKDVICAQSILFFLAGFDTVQSLLLFATYQLAISPEIQDKLVEEVNESYKKNGNAFTYESIHAMEYLDKFISETLRMYPPAPRLDRRCTKGYTIPGTKLVIPVGTLVVMPSYAIHHDEEFYPEPYRFDPERFSKEGKAARSPYAYMPFGHGPRNCIGMRFALTESKLALARLVQNFIIEPSEKTPIPMKFTGNGSLKPDGGMWLNLKPRN